MHQDLECRVCYEVPRPDKIIPYGLCLERGHLTCSRCCHEWMDEMGDACQCPYCRKRPFKLTGGHLLANKILSDLAKIHMYPCENCHHEFPGSAILDHEDRCSVGKFLCPLCLKYVSQRDLFALKHPCMPSRSVYNSEKKVWDKVLFFDNLFYQDSAVYMLHGGFEVKLCLSYKVTESGLLLNVFWVDHQTMPDPDAMQLRIGANLFTEAGTLFKEAEASIHKVELNGFEPIEPTPQLWVKMKDLIKWEHHSQSFRCNKCCKRSPHIHIRMDFV